MINIIFDPYNYPFWILIFTIIALAIAIISRPLSTYIKFVYPSAKFETLGNPFIMEKELDRIVETKNILGFREMLNTTGNYNIHGDTIYDIQKSIDSHLIKNIEMMRKDSSKKMNDFYNTYIEKLDMYIIKNTLINKIKDQKIDNNIINDAILLETKSLLQKIIDSEKKNLPEILKNHGFKKEVIDTIIDERFDLLKLDNKITKHVICKIKKVKVPYKCENAKQKFANILIDIINIKNILRAKQNNYDEESCKRLFIGEGQEIANWKFNEMTKIDSIPQIISSLEGTSYYNVLKNSIELYNKSESTQVFENAIDCLLLKLVKELSIQNYSTIGPTFRFIVSKEYEIKNLKIIAKGIGEGLQSDIIKSNLIKEINA